MQVVQEMFPHTEKQEKREHTGHILGEGSGLSAEEPVLMPLDPHSLPEPVTSAQSTIFPPGTGHCPGGL